MKCLVHGISGHVQRQLRLFTTQAEVQLLLPDVFSRALRLMGKLLPLRLFLALNCPKFTKHSGRKVVPTHIQGGRKTSRNVVVEKKINPQIPLCQPMLGQKKKDFPLDFGGQQLNVWHVGV